MYLESAHRASILVWFEKLAFLIKYDFRDPFFSKVPVGFDLPTDPRVRNEREKKNK